MLQNLYRFTPQLILRTPAQHFTLDIDESAIERALYDAQFMEALYLASPALHEECYKWQRGELTDARKLARLRHTLARYYTRSRSRCTPFGLFAGCSLIAWGPTSHLRLLPEQPSRHTRLDMHYLCALAQQLADHEDLRLHLRYYPNTSLHEWGQELRFVEQQYQQGECVHQLSAIDASPLVQQVMTAAAGLTGHQLVEHLMTSEAEREEATAFVEELIQMQVLISELAPTVTGEEYFCHLQAVLARLLSQQPQLPVQAAAHLLQQVQQRLSRLDQQRANRAVDYEQIVAALAPLGVPIEPGKLFQTDATHRLSAPAMLDQQLQSVLLEALEALAYMAPAAHNQRLTEFTRRFEARYEERQVPLLEALDAESGLAYANGKSSRYSGLVHDLVLASANVASASQGARPAIVQLLRRKLREAERCQQYSIEITLAEVRAVTGTAEAMPPLPPSIGVLFRPLGAGTLLLESADGASAVNLLGRFAHAEPGIERLIRQITKQEQVYNPAVSFAEICHLPASRIGNLVQRPHFRALEIPYLAQSTLPVEAQVAPQDLVLSVQAGQLLLHSRKTKRRIIPRLSTAHNFSSAQALPLYQFLCDLQTQGLHTSLSFSWQEADPIARFFPRVTCGQAVLAAARWHLSTADTQVLLACTPDEFQPSFNAFRRQWQLPRFFTLADGDNELFVDAENQLLCQVWLEAIRPRAKIVLKEFLFDPADCLVRDQIDQPYVAQGVALLVRQAGCYKDMLPARSSEQVQREFILGSEWLYYKLYCGQLIADRILLAAIRPLADLLRQQRLIDNWFFVRYADPENHLRIRWHLPDPTRVGEIVQMMEQTLHAFIRDHSIWKVQTDTYRRELERYGSRSIEHAEILFGFQSEKLLDHMAEQAASEAVQHQEIWLWGLAAVEELLNAFSYSLEQKLTLLLGLREAFAREFQMTKQLRRQLDDKYRAARASIEQALVPAFTPPATPLLTVARGIENLEQQGLLEIAKDRLIGSYIHMLLNRLLPADARLHELVLYDFLHRYYQSQQARRKR